MKNLIFILFTLVSLSLSANKVKDLNKDSKNNKRTILIKVTDASGVEIPGAKLICEENGEEYITDFNGKVQVSIELKKSITLKIQSLGFHQKLIHTEELSTFNDLVLTEL